VGFDGIVLLVKNGGNTTLGQIGGTIDHSLFRHDHNLAKRRYTQGVRESSYAAANDQKFHASLLSFMVHVSRETLPEKKKTDNSKWPSGKK
jgi:hypothetical protein